MGAPPSGPYFVLAALLKVLEAKHPGLLTDVFHALPAIVEASDGEPCSEAGRMPARWIEAQEAAEFLEALLPREN